MPYTTLRLGRCQSQSVWGRRLLFRSHLACRVSGAIVLSKISGARSQGMPGSVVRHEAIGSPPRRLD